MKVSSPNPFISRLACHMDAQHLRARLTATARAIAGLGQHHPHTAKLELQRHLKTVYVPTRRAIALAQRILASGLAHALQAYPDLATYIRVFNQASITYTSEPETWFITGLAGDGKTALVTALQGLLGEGDVFHASEQCGRRRVRGGIFLTVGPKTTKADVVTALAEKLEIEIDCEKASPAHLKKIQTELYRQGCCFILVDEAQANNSGKQAGASYVTLINLFRQFGVPVIVVGNYSMGHGLNQQLSQNKQRLLDDPFVMLTPASDDPDYLEHLLQYKNACGELLAIDPQKDAGRIHYLTAGGSRALLHLIGAGYTIARESAGAAGAAADDVDKVCITMDVLEKAYASVAYAAHRKEVETLRSHFLTGAKIPQDLICPFPVAGEDAAALKHLAQQMRREARAAAELLASLSPQERKAIREQKAAAPEFASSMRPGSAAAQDAGLPAPVPQSIGTMMVRDMQAPKPKVVRKPPPSKADLNRSWGR